jgi:hypothetical protein
MLDAQARPLSLAGEQLLEVSPAVADLLPGRGLRRGATMVVGGEQGRGTTSLVLGLLAVPTATGSWCAALGLPALGAVAAEELGVDLAHLALVPAPGRQWTSATAALLDGLDVVVVRPPGPVSPSDARRLSARARSRRSVLVVLGSSLAGTGKWPGSCHDASFGPRQLAEAWPGADLCLVVGGGEWVGLGAGFGRLEGRRLEVVVWGRGAAARSSRHLLWLPAAG